LSVSRKYEDAFDSEIGLPSRLPLIIAILLLAAIAGACAVLA
jgi:hypothetical protein